ncbi:MAG: PD-(D/E)XK nuclease domain-containing protein [Bacteroidota bacterium]|nr:PD-(D/E)XK nuclease domain-containing protein [Bacteroidota bacterium]
MDKLKRIEKYIFDFFSTRFELIDIFYRSTRRDRQTGIYLLKEGPAILDLLTSIHNNIEYQFFSEKLVPHKFSTPDALFRALDHFKKYLNDNQYLLDKNAKAGMTSYIVDDIQKIKDEIIEMADYAKQLYDMEDNLVPYQELRYKLITRNVPDFINILKSILASVSYAITKTKEGFFHSNVHLILKLLGFEIISEEMTNVGRIDAVIRFSDIIYILEFKFGVDIDYSQQALDQVKEKKYAEKFFVEQKEIIAVGISFNTKTKNINGYTYEKIDE